MRSDDWRCALVCLAIVVGGCGQVEYSDHRPSQPRSSGAEVAYDAALSPAEEASAKPSGRAASSVKAGRSAGGADRKLVFRAEVDLVVEDFAAFADRLDAALEKVEAFVASSSLSGLPGEPRRGQWRIRVPVAGFKDLVKSIARLGEVHRVHTSSDDVTEEYYDIEARIRNAQHEEARLAKLLEERTASLDAVLSVEREIARVRGEIERLQGRMRVLSELTALSTVELRVDEVRGYSPEQAPTFAVRVGRSFSSSQTTLGRLLQACAVALAMATPWLVFVAVPAAAMALLLRRSRRRAASGLTSHA